MIDWQVFDVCLLVHRASRNNGKLSFVGTQGSDDLLSRCLCKEEVLVNIIPLCTPLPPTITMLESRWRFRPVLRFGSALHHVLTPADRSIDVSLMAAAICAKVRLYSCSDCWLIAVANSKFLPPERLTCDTFWSASMSFRTRLDYRSLVKSSNIGTLGLEQWFEQGQVALWDWK